MTMTDINLKDSAKPSGPVKVGKLTVRIDRDLCIGAATCVAVAAKAFALDSDAKSVILSSADSEPEATILDAAKGCPTAAIIIEDENGNKVFQK